MSTPDSKPTGDTPPKAGTKAKGDTPPKPDTSVDFAPADSKDSPTLADRGNRALVAGRVGSHAALNRRLHGTFAVPGEH
jgi:hypothetical protein